MGFYFGLLVVSSLGIFLLFMWYIWGIHSPMSPTKLPSIEDDRPSSPTSTPVTNKNWYDGGVYSFPKPAQVAKIKRSPVIAAPTSRSN